MAGDGLEITETKDAVTGGLTTAATLTESADNASAKVSLTCTMPGQALALRLESYLPSGDPAGLMRASLRLGSLVFQDATPDEVPYSNVWVFHVSPVVEDLRARQLALRTAAHLADSLEAAIAAFETAQGTWSEEADADGERQSARRALVGDLIGSWEAVVGGSLPGSSWVVEDPATTQALMEKGYAAQSAVRNLLASRLFAASDNVQVFVAGGYFSGPHAEAISQSLEVIKAYAEASSAALTAEEQRVGKLETGTSPADYVGTSWPEIVVQYSAETAGDQTLILPVPKAQQVLEACR